jgi:class 3 adenylate cyclase
LQKIKLSDDDIEKIIKRCQKRVQGSLDGKSIYRSLPVPRSNRFLRKHLSEKHEMFVLFVDMIGSTKMSSELTPDNLSLIIRAFCQEISYIIEMYGGHVLKFVGDAVIGYFITNKKLYGDADKIIDCTKLILLVINRGINSILSEQGYKEIKVKIGLDCGIGSIILYSSDKNKAHIDIIGLCLNLAAKMQNFAEPNQIVIGNNVYTKLSSQEKKHFKKLKFDTRKWDYDFDGKIYSIYAHKT